MFYHWGLYVYWIKIPSCIVMCTRNGVKLTTPLPPPSPPSPPPLPPRQYPQGDNMAIQKSNKSNARTEGRKMTYSPSMSVGTIHWQT